MLLSDKDRIKIILEAVGIGQQAFADKLQVPVHKIKSIKSGKTKISPDIALRIEEFCFFNFKWILTGHGEPTVVEGFKVQPQTESTEQEEPAPEQGANVVKLKHSNAVKDFINQELALDVNLDLIEIEKIDPTEFREIGAYVKGVRRGLEKASKPINTDHQHDGTNGTMGGGKAGDAQKKNRAG